MPSPFPGMNPYLEREGLWPDFHLKFLAAINERLVPQLRPRYFARLEERLYVRERPDEPPRFAGRADLAVSPGARGVGPALGAGVLEAPARVELAAGEVERVPYLEIRDRRGETLVAALELLSPSNKRPGGDRDQYLAERDVLLASPAHFIEIDLLRGGRPLPASDRPPCAYSVLVSRAGERPGAGFWPIGLRDRLPEIPVPLQPPDVDARVDLQDLLHRVYDAYGYDDFVYQGDPEPPLAPDDAAWARALAAGRPAVD